MLSGIHENVKKFDLKILKFEHIPSYGSVPWCFMRKINMSQKSGISWAQNPIGIVEKYWKLWFWQLISCAQVKFQTEKTSDRRREQQVIGGGMLITDLASGWSQVDILVMKKIFGSKNFQVQSHLKGPAEIFEIFLDVSLCK